MKPLRLKHLISISIIVVVAALGGGCLYTASMFRPLGDRGAVYETAEVATSTFKVRTTALHETGVYLPGAYLIYESAPVDSDEWHEFLSYRIDDPKPIPSDRVRVLSEDIAYVCLSYDFAVTLDGGRNWKIWKPLFPLSNGELVYWTITDARVQVDGSGVARLEAYDQQLKAIVELRIITEDFGQTWNVGP